MAAVAVVDLMLLLANLAHHVVHTRGGGDAAGTVFGDATWNGDLDGSHIEIVGHAQVVGTVVALVAIALTRRSLLHAAWATAFGGLLLDDFLQLHERGGVVLTREWSLPSAVGLRPDDLGELIVWGGEAVVLGSLVVIATALARPSGRRDSMILFGCMVVIAVFGVGVDQAHIILEPQLSPDGAFLVALTETAGELVGMSLALLAAARMTRET